MINLIERIVPFGFLSLTIIFLLGLNEPYQESPFSVKFRLLNKTTCVDSSNQFSAIVIFTNINHPTIEIEPYIMYGWDGNDPFTVVAYDLNDNQISISKTNVDYDYMVSDNFIKFGKGNLIQDTIQSKPFYHFKEKGTYKLRIDFNPDNLFIKHGKITGQFIYSNWDTLTVR